MELLFSFVMSVNSVDHSIVASMMQVFRTTTLMEDIASFTIDPRPWLIVFGKNISNEDFESRTISFMNLFMRQFTLKLRPRWYEDENVLAGEANYIFHKKLTFTREERNDKRIQFEFVRCFLINKTPSVPERRFVRMEANYILMFNYFNVFFQHLIERVYELKYIKLEYSDFPKYYITTYPDFPECPGRCLYPLMNAKFF